MKAAYSGNSGNSPPCAIFPFLFSLFIVHTQSLALTPPLSLISPINLTDVWTYRHCVSDPSWNPQNLHIASACENAFVAFSDDTLIWGLHTGTFTYRPSARSTAYFPGKPSVLTLPKRYVSGECVVAIVMMKMFERSSIGQFPGLPDSLVGKWRSRDTSTWKRLIEPAEYVRATCANACGYAVVGRDFGIGVAIWEKGSIWDRYAEDILELSGGEDVMPALEVGNASVGGVGNGTVLEALR